ncbi:MAG: type II CAAX endopeptidase family protein [Anaerolineae bacterium]|nr:CPBP family intramembrane metalloprotease [Thermoflexales bacterium]MDW8407318.1 type II CAAX endopeptidase family protein [Anaerolineae bacterium]
MSSNPFLSTVEAGKNAAWRYLLGIVVIVIVWQATGFLAGLLLFVLSDGAANSSMLESPVSLAIMLLSFTPLLLMPMLVNRWVHGRPASALFGAARRLNWRQIGFSAALWVLLMATVALVSTILGLSQYEYNGEFVGALPMVLVGLLLLPVQTSAEEVFFRGYLLQATGRLTHNVVLLSIVNGILFALPHFANPEMSMGPLFSLGQWFVIGFGLALITLRSGSLDAALGIHAANNVASFVLFGYRGGSLPAVALFVEDAPDPALGLVALVIATVIAYWVLGRQSVAQVVQPAHTTQS